MRRLVTGTLVHGLGLPQLAVNMVALLVFGVPLERALGGLQFAARYFAAGGLAWLAMLTITDPSSSGRGRLPPCSR